MTTETATPEEIWAEEANAREAAETEVAPAPAEEAAPQEQEATQVEAQAPAEETPPAEEDPYAGLPEAAKERLRKLDELERSQTQLLHQVRTAEGRVSAMQRELEQAKKAAASAEGPSQAQIAAAGKSLQKWESLKQDFPEWAEAMEEFVLANKSKADPVDIEAKVELNANAIVARYEKQRIERRYRNWEQEVRKPEFGSWLDSQPAEVKALADSPISDDAIELLQKWYATKEVKQERKAKLAAAATTKPGTSAASLGRSVEDMSPEELWAFEAAEREKRRRQLGA